MSDITTPRKTPKPILFGIGLVALAIGIGGAVATSQGAGGLEAAQDMCSGGVVHDDGDTLVLDVQGEEEGTGIASYADVLCVLGELEAPYAVTERMNGTSALDGVQEETWDSYEASWSYHPDDGLDVIITRQ